MKPFLLGDIGGTNARFALAEGGSIGPIERRHTADTPDFLSTVERALSSHGGPGAIAGAAFAVAGPVENGRCALTNSPWVVDRDALRHRLGLRTVIMMNDFAAVARSLPALGGRDLVQAGGGEAVSGTPAVVFGPGTGLGVAALIKHASEEIVIASEGGHATFASADERQEAVVRLLRARHGHVSIERVLSGGGLVALHDTIATIDGKTVPARDAAAITSAAREGSCEVCRAALEMFCAILGSVAGNLALTFGAQGGVYIAGGIVPRFADRLGETRFRQQFEAKGRFQSYLAPIPCWVITHSDAALVGLARMIGSGPS
ncbi:MAG TPA: glucokinase [Hypericibacter adhaerens]|uniref:Glucokinase n=1 Tax=Hypericibacter adhaerens TaxID=2602016 RepID=A0A5J6N764_9PROT|nr:glucokinase [Hypericibacter adhaerens]QEX22876.1 glucokinase [Hypericibacter adhaerens]HWA44029.1 glucokinase [Hypericibacter adhaerens]